MKPWKKWTLWALATLAAVGAALTQLPPNTIAAKVGGVVERTAPVAGGIVLTIPDSPPSPAPEVEPKK